MKKTIAIALAVMMILTCLAGCAKKTEVVITFPELDGFEFVQRPAGMVNFSSTDNSINMTVKQSGEYPFVIKSSDGTEYSFVLTYNNGSAVVETSDDIAYIAGIK